MFEHNTTHCFMTVLDYYYTGKD